MIYYSFFFLFLLKAQVSIYHHYSFTVRSKTQTQKATIAPQSSLLCENSVCYSLPAKEQRVRENNIQNNQKSQPMRCQNIIRRWCFIGTTAAAGMFEESKCDSFVHLM